MLRWNPGTNSEKYSKYKAEDRPGTLLSSSEICTAFPRQIRTPVSRKTPKSTYQLSCMWFVDKDNITAPKAIAKQIPSGSRQLSGLSESCRRAQAGARGPGPIHGAFLPPHEIPAPLTLSAGSWAHRRRNPAAGHVLLNAHSPSLFFPTPCKSGGAQGEVQQ